MYKIKLSGRFKKSYKKCIKRGLERSSLEYVIKLLVNGEVLPKKYKNHQLSGNYEGCMECHISPDWLLIWKYNDDELTLYRIDTGTHIDLFE